jgi:SRP54-type protein, GTPase domain
MSSVAVSYEVLQLQNAATSNAVIQCFHEDPAFEQLSTYEGHLTQQRDAEDDAKLLLGIQYAQEKGVLDPHFLPEPYIAIDVLNQTPDRVAETILQHVHQSSDKDAQSGGHVIVLVGLSGTGKGTTVSKLVEQLQAAGHDVVTWSNGNLFRSVTLLAATWCEQNGGAAIEDALTKENLESFMDMLSFGKHPETQQYDTRIQGLGYDTWISAIQNTELKQPKVSKNIPTVAQVTQVRSFVPCIRLVS